MPVGNASDGIGLFAGQIMVTANMNMQHIDWSHDPTTDETFDHWGHLNSKILVNEQGFLKSFFYLEELSQSLYFSFQQISLLRQFHHLY